MNTLTKPAALLCAALGLLPLTGSAGTVGSDCTLNGIRLYGRVQVVDNFPDLKVQVVDNFPDLKVQKVSAFADQCGKWEFVSGFADFKIQFVDSFPDLKIRFVSSFPGPN